MSQTILLFISQETRFMCVELAQGYDKARASHRALQSALRAPDRFLLRIAWFLILWSTFIRVDAETTTHPLLAFQDACSSSSVPAGLMVTISAPKQEYFCGEQIPITFHYRNTSTKPVSIYLPIWDRSGRVDGLKWFAISDTGSTATDPIGDILSGAWAGGPGGSRTIANGTSCTETLDANEWLWFEPGEYQLSVASYRAYQGGFFEGPLGPLCSNWISLTIRKPTDAEIDAQIAKSRQEIEWFGYLDRVLKPLRYLHSMRALPVYLKYYESNRAQDEMEFAIYGIPNATATLSAFSDYLRAPGHVLTPGDEHLFEALFRKANDLPSQNEDHTVPSEVARQLRAIREAFTADEHR